MSTQAVLPPRLDNPAGRNHMTTQFPAEPFVVRLENIPATPHNRKRVGDRVRELNRMLEESGTPFRLRLL